MKKTEITALTMNDIVGSSAVFGSFVYCLAAHFWQATNNPGRLRALLSESIIRCIEDKNGDIDNSKAGLLMRKELGTKSHSVKKISEKIFDELINADFRVVAEEEKYIQIALSKCAYILALDDPKKWSSATQNGVNGTTRIKNIYEGELSGIKEFTPGGKELAEQIKASLLSRIGSRLIRHCRLTDQEDDDGKTDAPKWLYSVEASRLLTAAVIIAINYQNLGEEEIRESDLDPLTQHIRQYLLCGVKEPAQRDSPKEDRKEKESFIDSDKDRLARQMNALKDKLRLRLSLGKSDSDVSSKFVGRKWLMDECENWRINQHSRALLLYGPPGFGKTTFVEHYGRNHPYFPAVFFCSWNNKEQCTASLIIRSMAYQLAGFFPGYRSLLLDLLLNSGGAERTLLEDALAGYTGVPTLFRLLITDPLLQCGLPENGQRYVILIDALNEMKQEELEALSEVFDEEVPKLPERLCFLFTSQKTDDVDRWFSFLQFKTLSTLREENRQDIREYTEKNLLRDAVGEGKRSELIDLICKKSEGVFLYVSLVVQAINNGTLDVSAGTYSSLPGNLNKAIRKYFSRVTSEKGEFDAKYRKMFSMICASPEPLPLKHIMQELGLGMSETEDRIAQFAPFLNKRETGGKVTVSLSYQYYYLWFTNREMSFDYYCPVEDGANLLADLFISYYEKKTYRIMSLYMLRNFLTILEMCGERRRDERIRIINDEVFLSWAIKRLFDMGFTTESNQLCTRIFDALKRDQGKEMNYAAIVAVKLRLAINYINQGKIGITLSELHECERLFPLIREHYPLKTSILSNTAWTAREDNQLALADQYLEKAQKMSEKMDSSYEAEEVRGDMYYTEGGILYKRFNQAKDPDEKASWFAACETALRRSVETWQALGENDDIRLQITFAYMTWAWLHLRNGDYRQSYKLFMKTLEVRENIFGSNPNSPYIAKSLGNIAGICLKIAESENNPSFLREAIETCDRAISIYRKISGSEVTDYNAAVAMITKADILVKLDEKKQAIQIYMDAREIMMSYGKSKEGYVKGIDEKLATLTGKTLKKTQQ